MYDVGYTSSFNVINRCQTVVAGN